MQVKAHVVPLFQHHGNLYILCGVVTFVSIARTIALFFTRLASNTGGSMRREHREFAHDFALLVVNVTPLSWAFAVAQFTHKWGYKRHGARRIANRVNTMQRRRSFRIMLYRLKQRIKAMNQRRERTFRSLMYSSRQLKRRLEHLYYHY